MQHIILSGACSVCILVLCLLNAPRSFWYLYDSFINDRKLLVFLVPASIYQIIFWIEGAKKEKVLIAKAQVLNGKRRESAYCKSSSFEF